MGGRAPALRARTEQPTGASSRAADGQPEAAGLALWVRSVCPLPFLAACLPTVDTLLHTTDLWREPRQPAARAARRAAGGAAGCGVLGASWLCGCTEEVLYAVEACLPNHTRPPAPDATPILVSTPHPPGHLPTQPQLPQCRPRCSRAPSAAGAPTWWSTSCCPAGSSATWPPRRAWPPRCSACAPRPTGAARRRRPPSWCVVGLQGRRAGGCLASRACSRTEWVVL